MSCSRPGRKGRQGSNTPSVNVLSRRARFNRSQVLECTVTQVCSGALLILARSLSGGSVDAGGDSICVSAANAASTAASAAATEVLVASTATSVPSAIRSRLTVLTGYPISVKNDSHLHPCQGRPWPGYRFSRLWNCSSPRPPGAGGDRRRLYVRRCRSAWAVRTGGSLR